MWGWRGARRGERRGPAGTRRCRLDGAGGLAGPPAAQQGTRAPPSGSVSPGVRPARRGDTPTGVQKAGGSSDGGFPLGVAAAAAVGSRSSRKQEEVTPTVPPCRVPLPGKTMAEWPRHRGVLRSPGGLGEGWDPSPWPALLLTVWGVPGGRAPLRCRGAPRCAGGATRRGHAAGATSRRTCRGPEGGGAPSSRWWREGGARMPPPEDGGPFPPSAPWALPLQPLPPTLPIYRRRRGRGRRRRSSASVTDAGWQKGSWGGMGMPAGCRIFPGRRAVTVHCAAHARRVVTKGGSIGGGAVECRRPRCRRVPPHTPGHARDRRGVRPPQLGTPTLLPVCRSNRRTSRRATASVAEWGGRAEGDERTAPGATREWSAHGAAPPRSLCFAVCGRTSTVERALGGALVGACWEMGRKGGGVFRTTR